MHRLEVQFNYLAVFLWVIAWHLGNRISESTLDLELRATDHGAEIQCRPELSVSGQSPSPQVSSVGSPYNGTGLEASVRLTVYCK